MPGVFLNRDFEYDHGAASKQGEQGKAEAKAEINEQEVKMP